MARALIDPITNRLVQVESKSFPVASPLFWVTVPANVTPETHTYNGTAVVPMPPPDEEPIALARLVELDRLSLRALREYVANKADAPPELIDIEGQAVAERAKIKPKNNK